MNKHFSYLLDEPAQDFFMKAAGDAAERIYGISAADPAPMEKKASAPPKSSFEKVASRLDRDLGILKTAGSCGWDLGMCKRADAYVDVLLSNCHLSPDEFGELFDKIAAESIQTDLEAAYRQSCSGLEAELHPMVERHLAKLGYDLAGIAMMEKEAFAGRLIAGAGKMLGKWRGGRGMGYAARGERGIAGGAAAVKNVARGEAAIAGSAARGLKERVVAPFRQGAANYRAARATAAKDSAKALGKEMQGYRQQMKMHAPGSAQHDVAKAALGKGSQQAKKIYGPQTPKAPAATPSTAAAPAGTTAPSKPPAESLSATSQTKQVKAEGEAARAQSEASKAAKTPSNDNVIPIRKSTGTDGPAPKPQDAPKSKPDVAPENIPAVSPAAAEAAGAPKGVIEKLKTEGWNSLTGAEKLQAAAGAYVGGKVVFGDGL
jgi:hypothetical protein